MPLPFPVMRRTLQLSLNDRRSPSELAAARERALGRLLEFARSRSPFYARFHRGLSGAPLAELPVLTKQLLMESFEEVITDRTVSLASVEGHLERLPGEPLRGRYHLCSTSGSTGRRGFFLFSGDEWAGVVASFRRAASWSGIPPWYLFAPGAAVVSPVPWHMSAQLGSPVRSAVGLFERLQADEPVETMVHRLNRRTPLTLFVYPSVGRLLAREQLEGRLRIAPRYVFT
ncbi:MAG TPA: phenylacetate--CoA ligase family protein, partial [Verrucomicrobiae bacterium]|nr:phenylacetate--CoA ligase family protein [Verrucomicrobiae bacterium]